jgi:hypothetical protein
MHPVNTIWLNSIDYSVETTMNDVYPLMKEFVSVKAYCDLKTVKKQ